MRCFRKESLNQVNQVTKQALKRTSTRHLKYATCSPPFSFFRPLYLSLSLSSTLSLASSLSLTFSLFLLLTLFACLFPWLFSGLPTASDIAVLSVFLVSLFSLIFEYDSYLPLISASLIISVSGKFSSFPIVFFCVLSSMLIRVNVYIPSFPLFSSLSPESSIFSTLKLSRSNTLFCSANRSAKGCRPWFACGILEYQIEIIALE